MRQDQVPGGVSVLWWLTAPAAMFYGNLQNLVIRSKSEIRGLSGKFADTANKTRIVYHRLLKFCINKYQLSNTVHTQYDRMFLNID